MADDRTDLGAALDVLLRAFADFVASEIKSFRAIFSGNIAGA